MGLVQPVNLRLIAVDLAAVSLDTLDLPPGATWNWLGVTQYLDKRAIETVLSAIAAKGSGSTVVVEFLLAEAECDELGKAFRAQARAVAASSGEP